MDRRTFMQMTGAAGLGMSLNKALAGTEIKKENLLASDMAFYLKSLYPVDSVSVDRIIIGDPDTKITKIGTAWMPYWDTLKQAVDAGVNTMIVHEPTFYTHQDLRETTVDYYSAPEPAKSIYLEQVEKKKKWILDNKLVIIRCHDVLDILPGIGVPYAFGRLLGFSPDDLLQYKDYYQVYKTEPRPALQVVKELATRLLAVNQQGVQFYGDPNYMVSKVGLGTGCGCDPMQYMEFGADLYIAIDDTIRTWIQTVFAQDTGRPLVVINHGASEENGMRLLNLSLKEQFTQYEFIHYNQGCGYKWITA